jgi:two-component system nitrate/nitrite response regulator NarL
MALHLWIMRRWGVHVMANSDEVPMSVAVQPRRRLLIVDDHELFAHTVSTAMTAEGFDVSRARSIDPRRVIEQVERDASDVVLLDLDLGGSSALPLVRPLSELGATVVMVTAETDRVRLAECVEAGAVGVVSKSAGFGQFVDAIAEAAELGSLLTRHQREELLAELRRQRASDREKLEAFRRLTPREEAVLTLLVDGRSAEAIAAHEVVAVSTVRSQIRSVLTKLGVNSQLGAVALARRVNWPADQAHRAP